MQSGGLIWLVQVNTTLARLGGLGLIGMGILDSSLVPLPGSQDFLTILLAARNHEWWLYYAAMSTVGSVVGSYLTYRLGRKGGEEALEQKISKKRMKRVSELFEKWGFATVFMPALMPPPVPMVPFVLGAGALNYPLRKFLAAYTAARFIRFSIAAYLAALYGRRVFAMIVRNGRLLLVLLVSCMVAGALVAGILYVRKRFSAAA